MAATQNQLLDLANVRYLVYPRLEPAYPSYRNVPFDPDRPLIVGARGSPGGAESFAFSGEPGHRVQVVAALTHGFAVAQDDTVAEVSVVATTGEKATFPLRAGRDVAEWAYDRADALGKVKHLKPDSIAFQRMELDPVLHASYPLSIFYSEHDLPHPMAVQRVDVRYVHPQGSIEVFGLGVYNAEARQTEAATPRKRSNLHSVFRDADVEILENDRALGRTWVVSRSIEVPVGPDAIGFLLYASFDPRETVLLDADHADPDWGKVAGSAPAGEPPRSPGSITSREPATNDRESLTVEVEAEAFLVRSVAYHPGWRAWIDGVEVRVQRANYLFQAISIPAGGHRVEFRYQPHSLNLGLGMTAGAAGITLSVALACVLVSIRCRQAREES